MSEEQIISLSRKEAMLPHIVAKAQRDMDIEWFRNKLGEVFGDVL